MKKIILLAIISLVLIVADVYLWNIYSIRNMPDGSKKTCLLAGGEWAYLPNSCRDSCEYVRNPDKVVCLQAFDWGCDCGNDKCWEGKQCVND